MKLIKNAFHSIFHQRKGFSLVELIIVLAIAAVLVAILVPTLAGYPEKARRTKALQEGNGAMEAALAAYTEACQYASEEKTTNTPAFTDGTYYGMNNKDYPHCSSISNFAIVNRTSPRKNLAEGTKIIGRKLFEYLGDNYYDKKDIYGSRKKAADIDKLIGSKYAVFFVIDNVNAKILEFDYMRDHYLFIYKDGVSNVYPAATSPDSFAYANSKSTTYTAYLR